MDEQTREAMRNNVIASTHAETPYATEELTPREIRPRDRVHDEEAERIERTLQRIMVKQFITIPEFALLFNCSRGHVDKLLDQAQQPNCKYPLPYVDLNGLIQFDRLEVLEWARLRKPFDRKRRKTGGKKKAYPVAVNQ